MLGLYLSSTIQNNKFKLGYLMKTLGLIGGMSWESTAIYYQHINKAIQQRLGGFHSAKIILSSVDFAEIEQLQRKDLWSVAGQRLKEEALRLQRAGAEAIVLCTNTMHLVAPELEDVLSIPFLHIIDSTAAAICQQGIKCVGLLGTSFTMEQPFYTDRLQEHGLLVKRPSLASRAIIHRVIYEELCQGQIRPSSKQQYIEIIKELKQQGAEAIILGCTEIGMLLPEVKILDIPLFDTTHIHIATAVEFALSD